MSFDLRAAEEFMAGHARILDRRRLELRIGSGDPAAALAALDGYRNSEGGYGWGLEPDLHSTESQPGAAHHAFEVFEEIAPATAPQAAALRLARFDRPSRRRAALRPASAPDRGLGPGWTEPDLSASSLQPPAYVLSF